MVSKASEDLPEPDRPVNTTSLSRGISKSMFFRLCSRAPRMVIARRLLAGCWRRAFRISSITDSLDNLVFGRRAFGRPWARGDAHLRLRLAGLAGIGRGCVYARNVGRTASEFLSGIAPINRFANRLQQRSACQRFREGTYHAKTKRPAGSPAFSDNCWSRSVSRNHRAPEGVVEANGAHVHVLVDVVDAAQAAANKIEGDVAAAHEQVIVFEGNRPARCEADFKTGANRATPAALAGVVEDDAEELAVVLVVCDGRAALHIPKDVVPGIADLAGKQSDCIQLGVVSGARTEDEARVGPRQVSPVALRFEAEHPVSGLPAIADLTTDQSASCVVAALAQGGG